MGLHNFFLKKCLRLTHDLLSVSVLFAHLFYSGPQKKFSGKRQSGVGKVSAAQFSIRITLKASGVGRLWVNFKTLKLVIFLFLLKLQSNCCLGLVEFALLLIWRVGGTPHPAVFEVYSWLCTQGITPGRAQGTSIWCAYSS